ncbi:MAG: FAD-dependent oxidoreductase [Opitutales bacterium]
MLNVFNHAAIPTYARCEVLVLGAGSAGCCAAIAASQSGAGEVILVERQGFAGGTSTGVLDTFYGFFTPGDQPRKVVGGLPDRIVDALDAAGSMFLRPNTYGAGTGVTYNPERLKYVWDEALAEAGVRVCLHATLVDVDTDAPGAPRSVIVHARGRFLRIVAKRFIDATGDAEFCALAGLPFEKAGEQGPAQTLTTTFRMAGVDLERFEANGGKRGLQSAMQAAVEKGTHPLPRKHGSFHAMPMRGCVATVAVRVADIDADDFEQLTRAEQEGRRQVFIYENFMRDCVPGYEHSRIAGLSHQIGIRETRRVHGEYRLTREDCLSVTRFVDRVLLCGAPIEDHRPARDGEAETHWAYVPDGQAYDVPYRTLVPRGSDVVWVVGRCFSATHDAHASCRSMGQTMSMGQAAGLAATRTLKDNCGARALCISQLQDDLRALGAVLETPDSVSTVAADAWKANRHLV